MSEKLSKQSQAVVFRTPEGTLVWDTLENSNTGAEMIKERESQGNRIMLVTSPEEAKNMVKQQTDKNKNSFFFER